MGFVTDFGVSQILGIPVAIIALISMPNAFKALQGGDVAAITASLVDSKPFLILGLLAAGVGQVAGGFVAAMLAPLHTRLNVAAAAGVTVLSSVLLLGDYPLWWRLISVVLVIPTYFLGALLFTRRAAKKAIQSGAATSNAPIAPPQ